jgi:hypothetical protein
MDARVADRHYSYCSFRLIINHSIFGSCLSMDISINQLVTLIFPTPWTLLLVQLVYYRICQDLGLIIVVRASRYRSPAAHVIRWSNQPVTHEYSCVSHRLSSWDPRMARHWRHWARISNHQGSSQRRPLVQISLRPHPRGVRFVTLDPS